MDILFLILICYHSTVRKSVSRRTQHVDSCMYTVYDACYCLGLGSAVAYKMNCRIVCSALREEARFRVHGRIAEVTQVKSVCTWKLNNLSPLWWVYQLHEHINFKKIWVKTKTMFYKRFITGYSNISVTGWQSSFKSNYLRQKY